MKSPRKQVPSVHDPIDFQFLIFRITKLMLRSGDVTLHKGSISPTSLCAAFTYADPNSAK